MTVRSTPEEIAKRHTRKRFNGADPFTIHYCPVCKEAVALRDVVVHLRSHGQIPEHLKEEVWGFRCSANQVMSSYNSVVNKVKLANSENSSDRRGLHADSRVSCPICLSRMELIDYVEHWTRTHRYESGRTLKDRKRVNFLYRKSRAMGGRTERSPNPIKVKDNRKAKLGKGPVVRQIVSGGLPSLGKRK